MAEYLLVKLIIWVSCFLAAVLVWRILYKQLRWFTVVWFASVLIIGIALMPSCMCDSLLEKAVGEIGLGMATLSISFAAHRIFLKIRHKKESG